MHSLAGLAWLKNNISMKARFIHGKQHTRCLPKRTSYLQIDTEERCHTLLIGSLIIEVASIYSTHEQASKTIWWILSLLRNNHLSLIRNNQHYKKLFNLWQINFITDNWKCYKEAISRIIMYWVSHIKQCDFFAELSCIDTICHFSNSSWNSLCPAQPNPSPTLVMKINIIASLYM